MKNTRGNLVLWPCLQVDMDLATKWLVAWFSKFIKFTFHIYFYPLAKNIHYQVSMTVVWIIVL